MKENEIPSGANRKKRCIGRGEGNGHGKTSCRGHKGAGARAGYSLRAGFEGGQMPLLENSHNVDSIVSVFRLRVLLLTLMIWPN